MAVNGDGQGFTGYRFAWGGCESVFRHGHGKVSNRRWTSSQERWRKEGGDIGVESGEEGGDCYIRIERGEMELLRSPILLVLCDQARYPALCQSRFFVLSSGRRNLIFYI